MSPAERRRWHAIDGIARIDSDDDMFCQGLVERGIITLYDCMFGNNYYTLTNLGTREFYGDPTP